MWSVRSNRRGDYFKNLGVLPLFAAVELSNNRGFSVERGATKGSALREVFSAVFVLHALRSKAGGAHLGTDKEFKETMKFLGFTESPVDFLQVYRTLIIRLTQFFAQI